MIYISQKFRTFEQEKLIWRHQIAKYNCLSWDFVWNYGIDNAHKFMNYNWTTCLKGEN
jgi:hypothetical protein